MKKIVLAMKLAVVAAFALRGAADVEDDDPNGGILERREAVPSRPIGVLDRQKSVKAEAFASAIRDLRIVTALPFTPGATNAPVRVEVVDEGDSITTLYPEEMRGVVSVKALSKDSPTKEVLLVRVQKAVARAGLHLMGSGYGPRGCLSSTVRSLADLDRLALDPPTPDAMTRLRGGRMSGVKMLRFATYQQACREGWAPPPANKRQKEIWDEVHQLPSKPIKIEFDPAKGK